VAEVAVPVVDRAHGAARLQPEPAHQAHGRRSRAEEGQEPGTNVMINFDERFGPGVRFVLEKFYNMYV
jgi:hypothetical protein